VAASLSGQVLLETAVLLFASFVVGELFERVGLESILGYIVTGLVLGPSFLGFSDSSSILGFATIGATLILFQAGLREQNVKEIFGNRDALELGTASWAVGSVAVFAAVFLVSERLFPDYGLRQFLFLALAYGMVDIGVPSKLMLERGMLRDRLGRYSIQSSVVNVSLGFLAVTAAVIVFSTGSGRFERIAGIAGFLAVFYLLHEFIERLDDYILMFEETESQFAVTFSLLLMMAYLTQEVGLSSVLGAFFAGVIVSRSDFTDSRAFQEKISAIGEGLFVPLFFAWFGLSLQVFGSGGILANIVPATVLFAASTVPKLGVGYLVSSRHGINSPLKAAGSLLSLDIETLVALLIAIDLGILGEEILQIFAPSVLFTTLTIVLIFSLTDRLEGSA
jgi:Kef-type K+ transport systems, membrane components